MTNLKKLAEEIVEKYRRSIGIRFLNDSEVDEVKSKIVSLCERVRMECWTAASQEQYPNGYKLEEKRRTIPDQVLKMDVVDEDLGAAIEELKGIFSEAMAGVTTYIPPGTDFLTSQRGCVRLIELINRLETIHQPHRVTDEQLKTLNKDDST